MPVQRTTGGTPGQLTSLAVAAILGVTLLAANGLGTYVIGGRNLVAAKDLPAPTGWIVNALDIESWPTYRGVEGQWVAWAVGAVVLLGLAVVTKAWSRVSGPTRCMLGLLLPVSFVLLVLIAVRAATAAVPLVGWTWTWQLGLALIWMLALCVWADRLALSTLAYAIAIAVGVLSGISLLYCIQMQQSAPTWPVGNVLLLTTICLIGALLLGTWAFALFVDGWRNKAVWSYLAAVSVAVILILVLVVLAMAGRRAAVLGLAVGCGFIAIVAVSLPSGQTGAEGLSQAPRRRVRWMVLPGLLVLILAGATVAPSLLSRGRWQSVRLRIELYKAANAVLWGKPSTPLVGIGPGHLGFELTTRMRPLHAESPRLFHGDVSDNVHSEPLQAIVELGLPLALLYLALPIGGLLGIVAACRNTQDLSARLTLLGVGAGLAAALAAEATSVGMRYPSVAMAVWALTGIGWTCGAKAGAFQPIFRALSPVGEMLERRPVSFVLGASGLAMSLTVLALAVQSVAASGYLFQAQRAFDAGQYSQAETLLSGQPHVPGTDLWLAWEDLHGRTYEALLRTATSPEARSVWRSKAIGVLSVLTQVSPGYQDALVTLGKVTDNWDKVRARCQEMAKYDPYDREARMVETYLPGATPAVQMESLRLGIRNASVIGALVNKVVQAAQDPAARQLMDRWMADARLALNEPDPAKWPDPLSLETLRLAVVLAGQQGKIAEARELSGQAVTLVDRLARDPRRQRLETVELEVYLDQAWFGWLADPGTARERLAALQEHVLELVRGQANTVSEKMAAEFTAMLWLSFDRQQNATRFYYMSNPGGTLPEFMKTFGVGYARLVAFAGTRVPAAEADMWVARGKKALGEDLWQQMSAVAAAYKDVPWWFGVMTGKQNTSR